MDQTNGATYVLSDLANLLVTGTKDVSCSSKSTITLLLRTSPSMASTPSTFRSTSRMFVFLFFLSLAFCLCVLTSQPNLQWLHSGDCCHSWQAHRNFLLHYSQGTWHYWRITVFIFLFYLRKQPFNFHKIYSNLLVSYLWPHRKCQPERNSRFWAALWFPLKAAWSESTACSTQVKSPSTSMWGYINL